MGRSTAWKGSPYKNMGSKPTGMRNQGGTRTTAEGHYEEGTKDLRQGSFGGSGKSRSGKMSSKNSGPYGQS